MKPTQLERSGSKPAAGARRPDREEIGLIGVGLLGSALAERLLGGGLGVVGFDTDSGRLQALKDLGGQPAGSAAEVAGTCRRIVLSLPTSATVLSVLDAISPKLSAGQILLDTTTGLPEDAEEAGRRAAARGAAYLDATVSGSSEQVRAAKAVVMAGGPAEAFAACRDLFGLFAQRAFHVGPAGSGSKMKLAANLVLGLNRAALAEGLAFAQALGLDLEQTLAILQEGAAYSRIMDAKGPKMISGDFKPQARLSQHLKDVRLILRAGAGAGAQLPLTRTHRALLELAEAAGLGAQDNSAIIRVLTRPPTSA